MLSQKHPPNQATKIINNCCSGTFKVRQELPIKTCDFSVKSFSNNMTINVRCKCFIKNREAILNNFR